MAQNHQQHILLKNLYTFLHLPKPLYLLFEQYCDIYTSCLSQMNRLNRKFFMLSNCIIEITTKVSSTEVQGCYCKKYRSNKSQNLFTHASVTPVVLQVYIILQFESLNQPRVSIPFSKLNNDNCHSPFRPSKSGNKTCLNQFWTVLRYDCAIVGKFPSF